jgi:type IV fimbrial biogenesis protein FimT
MARRRYQGVTLIELLVALTVLGLLMFAVMPSVGTWIRNTQVRNAASAMQAGLQLARNEAIRRNAAVRFSLVSLTSSEVMDNSCALSGSGVSWVVSVRDPSSNCGATPVLPSDAASYSAALAVAADPLVVETHAGGVGGRNVVVSARITDGSAAADAVVFNGFGRVENAGSIGLIDVRNETVSNDYRRYRIEVMPGGSVRMCDPTVASTTDSRHCASYGAVTLP